MLWVLTLRLIHSAVFAMAFTLDNNVRNPPGDWAQKGSASGLVIFRCLTTAFSPRMRYDDCSTVQLQHSTSHPTHPLTDSSWDVFLEALIGFFIITSLFFHIIAMLIRMPRDKAEELYEDLTDKTKNDALAALIFGEWPLPLPLPCPPSRHRGTLLASSPSLSLLLFCPATRYGGRRYALPPGRYSRRGRPDERLRVVEKEFHRERAGR